MTTKTKKLSRAIERLPLPGPRIGPGQMPPWNLTERLQHIEAMGKRIANFVQFMCQAEALTGISAEAKERAVLAFYEKMVVLERQLALIHDDFKLE